MAFNIASCCNPEAGIHTYLPDISVDILQGWILCWRPKLASSPEEAEREYMKSTAKSLSKAGLSRGVYSRILRSGRVPVKRACRCEI